MMKQMKKDYKELKHHRLDDLISYFSKDKRNEHIALNDCILTNDIYNELISLAKV